MTPLVPADVDLRGLHFMPLDVNRLRDSQLAINASGDEFRAAVLLWCASWNQIPAASLPSDDQTLAAYAGFGRDLKGWRKVKSGAMRGFVLCDDGRFYHPVVAEKAREAWHERVEFRERQDNDQERVKNYRAEHKALRDALRELGVTMPFDAKISELRAKLETEKKLQTETETVTPETLQELQDEMEPVTPVTVTRNAPAMAKTGTGTGTGTEKQKQGRAGAPDIPDWLPDDCWEMWHKFRNSRKGWTADARTLSLRTLAKLRESGEDPRKVIEQSIERGWTGLFPVKNQNGARPEHGTTGASPAAMRRLA